MKMSKPRTIQLANGEYLSTIKKNGKVFVASSDTAAHAEENVRGKVEAFFKKDLSHSDMMLTGRIVKIGVEKYRVSSWSPLGIGLLLVTEEPPELASDDGPEING